MPEENDRPKKNANASLAVLLIGLVVLIITAVFFIFTPEKSTGQELFPNAKSQVQHPKSKQENTQSQGWIDTKSVLYDTIYKDHNIDLYYGCEYAGINKVDFSSCNLPAEVQEKKRAGWIEAEHIVPASLMPARQFECWIKEKRKGCEQHDPKAQQMIYDLHNLAPAVGQVNADRGNKRYGEKEDDHTFVPNDCVKGDVARTWLFMHDQYGVELVPGEEEMFERWSEADPVSPWESERDKRIKKYTFVDNPYVKGQTPDLSGACPWEK